MNNSKNKNKNKKNHYVGDIFKENPETLVQPLLYYVELLAFMVYAHFLLRNQYKAVLSECLCPLKKRPKKPTPKYFCPNGSGPLQVCITFFNRQRDLTEWVDKNEKSMNCVLCLCQSTDL